jgi:hypothetical protein
LIVKPYKYTIKYDTHFCLLERDPCYEHGCKSGGTCVADASDQKGYTCTCSDGATGEYCQDRTYTFITLVFCCLLPYCG